MLHPEHYCSQRRVRGQSHWLGFLCKTLSFSVSSRFIQELSLTPMTQVSKVLSLDPEKEIFIGDHAELANPHLKGFYRKALR
jgi:hypothetical protein